MGFTLNSSDYIIELKGISKYFGSTCALENIDLTIRNGEFITLLGPSGCGKTTILRLISGFEQPTSGTVHINGEKVNDVPPEKRHVNTVFQNYALFPHMTVANNVAFGLKMQKVAPDEIKARVQKALQMVRLKELALRRPAELSGGQQQRVAIARAVVNNPLVLLLDEPFSALDFKLRKRMQLEIKHLQRQLGITFVFVTHDQEEALAMSDRVVVMKDGIIEQIGAPVEIYEEPKNMFVARFVGDINVLKGEIIESIPSDLSDSERAYRVLVEGEEFIVHSDHAFAKGAKVNILLRPEDLKIEEEKLATCKPFLAGKIVETVYKGATVDIVIRLDTGEELMAAEFFNEDDVDIDYTPGERVAVTWINGWEVVLHDEDA